MEKLTINHIASVLVEKYGIAPKDAEQFVAAMFDVIQDGVENDKQVKVRGLGTFKLVDVEPRESVNVNTGERVLIKGHSKISFIPDTSMKEMVNKPFSQFETVILNEGVDFAEPVAEATEPVEETAEPVDIPESVSEPAPVAATEQVSEPVTVQSNTEAKATEEKIAEKVVAEENVAEGNETAKENESTAEIPVENTPMEEKMGSDKELDFKELQSTVQEEDACIEEQEAVEEEKENQKKSGVLWWVILVVLLIGGSGYFGYWLASLSHTPSMKEEIVMEPESVPVESSQEKAVVEKPAAATSQKEQQAAQDTVKAVAPAQSGTSTAANVPAESALQKTAAKYDALDTRVGTGAYCIVGEETTVKVKAGETMKIISKRALGPGMECYVEVFNNLPANPELKEGQTIKIPKVELRKRVFKKNKGNE